MSKKITKEVVENISQLARVDIDDKQKDRIVESFGPIMEMIDQVNSVDLGDEVKRNFRLKNIMRDDEVREDTSENRDDIIAEFPEKQDDYLKTKKILG